MAPRPDSPAVREGSIELAVLALAALCPALARKKAMPRVRAVGIVIYCALCARDEKSSFVGPVSFLWVRPEPAWASDGFAFAKKMAPHLILEGKRPFRT
jgi:hypothetical protein